MKKTKSLVLSVFLSVGCILGCGAVVVPAASRNADAAEAAPVFLTVSTTFAGENGNMQNYRAACEEWEAQSKNTVLDASAASDELFKARVLSEFETGAEPDVLFYFNGVDANAFVQAGKVVSIEEIRQKYPDYASNMQDERMGASPVDGQNYAVPVNGYWEGLFINKNVLEQSGVAVPGSDYTWEAFHADCEKIKSAGFAPIAASLAQIPHYWFEYATYNYNTPADHAILPTRPDDQHAQAWIDGLGDMKELYEKGYFLPDTLSMTDDASFQQFVDGKAAFLIDGAWKIGGIENKFKTFETGPPDAEKIAGFTVSYVPGKNARKASDIIGGLSSGYYITRKAWENPDKCIAAVDFVRFMTSDRVVSQFAGVSVSALKNDISTDESTLSTLARDGLSMIRGATGMSGAVQDSISPSARVPLFEGMPDLVLGKTQPEDAVAACFALMEAEKGAAAEVSVLG